MNIQAPVPAGFRRAERLAAIGVSEILKITAEAAARRHAGHPVISLGAGEPDFDTPAHIKDAAVGAIRAGATKYTALDGSPDLKEAVRGKFRRENHLSFSLAEITCASGAKQIIYNALMATLDPGDQVIIPAPYWTSYVDIVTICGGQPVICSCGEANDFKLRPEDLARIVTPRSRWLILNSPGNPSGSAYTGPELLALAGELERHPGLWVLSDDIYEHIVYDGFAFTTLAEVAPQLSGRILTVNGISKAYAMTGWRTRLCGWAARPYPRDGGRTEPVDILPQFGEPSGGDRRANRPAGYCARADASLPTAARPGRRQPKPHPGSDLPASRWRLLRFRWLRWRSQLGDPTRGDYSQRRCFL